MVDGVFVDGSDATAVFDTVLISNKEAGDSGGGVYSFESGLSVTDSTFTGNMALGGDSGGGGLDVLGAGLVSPAFFVIGGLLNSNTAIQGAGGFESVDNAGSLMGRRSHSIKWLVRGPRFGKVMVESPSSRLVL